jgi:phosphotransferase system HPr (HPr) family protein
MPSHEAIRRVTITNPTGLHARPALAIVNTVRKHQSKVEIRRNSEVVDGGEILQLLTLGAPQGTELELAAKGPDAEAVLEALVDLFARGFDM